MFCLYHYITLNSVTSVSSQLVVINDELCILKENASNIELYDLQTCCRLSTVKLCWRKFEGPASQNSVSLQFPQTRKQNFISSRLDWLVYWSTGCWVTGLSNVLDFKCGLKNCDALFHLLASVLHTKGQLDFKNKACRATVQVLVWLGLDTKIT